MNLFYLTLLQADSTGGMSNLIFLLLIFVVFYFFMIRPQMQKSKQQKKFSEAISKGDKIVTVGGMHGKILDIKDDTVIIELLDQSRVLIDRSAISMESTAKSYGAK
jgi:preprotein translocase subunit YajC